MSTARARSIVGPAPTTDAELLARIAKGNLDTLGLFYDRYADDVRSFVARLGVATADLDDVTQQVFLVVIRASTRFDGRESARAWLFGLAVNVVRRHRRSLGEISRRLVAWASEPRAITTPAADEGYALQETAHRAHLALEELSSKKREVFVLFAIEGLSGEEIAVALDIPIATVWTRLHHARRELRALLGERT